MESRDNSSAERQTTLLIHEIRAAAAPETIRTIRARLPRVIETLLENGAKVRDITRLITAMSDAIVARLIRLTLAGLGAPPAPFAFMAMGSEGRAELTFAADQDNAIVFADARAGAGEAPAAYFHKLGGQVCAGLNHVGYSFCRGEAMARNPNWRRSLSEWKRYFTRWVETPVPRDLRDVNIFFDFRAAYGDQDLVAELRRHVLQAVKDRNILFFHMAKSALEFKPPIGFFGNIMVASAGNHPATFDIKSAIVPIVNFARLYAVRHAVSETNTLDRLDQLMRRGVLSKPGHAELTEGYNALMRLRLKHQVALIANDREPDNSINPRDLTGTEQALLKNIFARINLFQSKISLDFPGTT